MKHIVSFSGGKDSTAMLLLLLERGMKIDQIIFADITKDFPGMNEHIKKVEQYIAPLKITKIKIDFDYWMFEHIKTKGKRKGEKGYGFPDFQNRWCTALKRQAVKNVMPKKTIQLHGIAYNENERPLKKNVIYPLIDNKMTEKDNLKYCYSKGFDWGGLYEQFHRVSCWCCPLKRLSELENLYRYFPELWEKLRIMEEKSWRQFRPDYSVPELERKFSQMRLIYKE